MSQDQLYIWIGVIIVGAAVAYLIGHRKGAANATAATPAVPAASAPGIVAEIGSKISAAASDIKAHVTSTVAKAPAPAATASAILASTFPSRAALGAAIIANKINYMVTLDGAQINAGFGPPQNFFTQANGSVSTTPAAPAASVAEAPPPVAAAPSAGPSVGAVGTAAATAQVRDQYGSCNFGDKLAAAACALPDALYLAKMDMPFRLLVGEKVRNAQLEFCILSGTQTQINQVVNNARSTHAAEIATFNVSTYTGPLKGRYDSLVAGIEAGTVTYVALFSDTGTTT